MIYDGLQESPKSYPRDTQISRLAVRLIDVVFPLSLLGERRKNFSRCPEWAYCLPRFCYCFLLNCYCFCIAIIIVFFIAIVFLLNCYCFFYCYCFFLLNCYCFSIELLLFFYCYCIFFYWTFLLFFLLNCYRFFLLNCFSFFFIDFLFFFALLWFIPITQRNTLPILVNSNIIRIVITIFRSIWCQNNPNSTLKIKLY